MTFISPSPSTHCVCSLLCRLLLSVGFLALLIGIITLLLEGSKLLLDLVHSTARLRGGGARKETERKKRGKFRLGVERARKGMHRRIPTRRPQTTLSSHARIPTYANSWGRASELRGRGSHTHKRGYHPCSALAKAERPGGY